MEIPPQVRRTLFNEENIYYILLPTVYYYNYILFIFSQAKYTNTTRDGCIQGEHRRSGASFLQALTRLNFFDFQIFENFNDFSIVIDNSPESNGYKFLSMTRKFWRFSTLDQPCRNYGPTGTHPTQVQEFFQFCLRFWPTVTYVPFGGILRRRLRLYRRSKQLHSQLHDITRGDLFQYLFNVKTDTTY